MVHTPRIASLISSATEILYLLGLDEQVVGVSHECDYPSQVADKPRLTRSLVDATATSHAIDEQVRDLAGSQSALYAIDLELLATLAPDLVITQAQCDVCAVRYEDVVAAVRDTPTLGGAEILALNPQSLNDVLDDVERIGRATGSLAAANEARRSLAERVTRVRTVTDRMAPSSRIRAICLEWIDPPMVACNWMSELVAMAGADPGLSHAGRHSVYSDWRAIVDYDPQVLVIMPCGFGLERAIHEAQVLAGWPGWKSLAAVHENRVFAVDGNAYFNRSGPRLVDSLEILAHLFHPRHFRPPTSVGSGAWQRLTTQARSLVPAHPAVDQPGENRDA